MTLQEYLLSVLSSSALIGSIAYLSKEYIKGKLLGSIKYAYDQQLEELKADLKAKEQKISSLSSVALSGVSFRKNELYKFQLTAIQKFWDEVTVLSKAKYISNIMRSLPVEKIVEYTEKDEKIREIFENMFAGINFDLKQYDASIAEKTRPFISPIAWALFSAYKSIIINDVIKSKMLTMGANKEIFDTLKGNQNLLTLVTTALPEHKKDIDDNANISLYFLLEILEERILKEIDDIIRGKQSNKEAVEEAATILQAVNQYQSASNKESV